MNDCNDYNDCNDKNSLHYFMCHMTQEEYTEMIKDKELKKIVFNKIKDKSNKLGNIQQQSLFIN